MSEALAFWAAALLVAALATPIAFAFLRRFPDGGAGLTFALGLVLLGWLYFTLRVLSVLPPGRGGYLLAVGLLALISAAVAGRDRRFLPLLRLHFPAFLAVVGLFTLFFFCHIAYRSYLPDIVGTEQPMDFMYLNATLNAESYPPQDPWLAGERASYYYFGYLQIGALTSISGVPPAFGYNLGLAYTFAATATGAASLAFALARWVLGVRGRRWALGAALAALALVLFVGSLSAVFEWAAAHRNVNDSLFEAAGLEHLVPCTIAQSGEQGVECLRAPETDAWYPDEYFGFWWRGTRVIPNTITEFPFFSFLLGDLHPHVMSLPLALLSLGLAAQWWRGRSRQSWHTHARVPFAGIGLAVVLGALAFQNTWDVITFCAVFAAAVLLRNLRISTVPHALADTLTYVAPIFVLGVVAYLPWWLTFSSQASGFYAYVGKGTIPQHAVLQFGPILAAALLALTWSFRRLDSRVVLRSAALALPLVAIPLVLWGILAAARGDLGSGLDSRSFGGWMTLALYAASAWGLATAALAVAARGDAAVPVLGFAAVGALLLYGAELFFIRDIFYGSAPRLNTVFKLTYQAWVLLAVAGAVGLLVALRGALRLRPTPRWLAFPVLAIVAAGLVYPVLAVPNRTEGFEADAPKTIDGLAFLARTDPDEYALMQWVREHAALDETVIEASGRRYAVGLDGQPVIEEANVDYSNAGRVAARTGVSVPIGWYFHEIQWRGDTPKNATTFRELQDDMDRVYLSQDPAESLDVLRRLDARYVIYGSEERLRFPQGLLGPLDSYLDVVFASGDLRVYAVPRYEVIQTS